MAHPNKKEGVVGHHEKLRRFTRDYGAANPKMNKAAPDDKYKKQGPEDAVGFGADSAAPSARKDRPARKTTPANPLATYANGGVVGMGAFASKKSRGERKPPAATNVNIIVAPGGPAGGAGAPPPMVPPPGVGAPPGPPPEGVGMPPMPPGGPAGGKPLMPGVMPPPGAIPPGALPPRASGGRASLRDMVVRGRATDDNDKPLSVGDKSGPPVSAQRRAEGGRIRKVGLTGGAGSGVGRYEKNDAPLPRANGGAVNAARKYGFDAGAGSGEGRLEKAEAHARRKDRPQAI